jgi:phosphonate ABC transporter permease subunit PhnE
MLDQDTKPTATRNALVRLLVVTIVVIGFVIYSYGWTVTDIDLDKPQEPQRQENVGNALRELLSPRIFIQEREVIEITASFLMACDSSDVEIPESIVHETGGIVTISPTCGETGDIIDVTISNFEPLADSRIRWLPPEGESRPREDLITGREELVLDNSGSFVGQIEVPRIRRTDGQIHQVAIRAALPTGPIQMSNITQLTILRMVETIFMALIATSIAIPIATLLSFFAARNLMRPIRITVGKLQIAFLSFVIGTLLGAQFLTGWGDFTVRVGQGQEFGFIGGIILPIIIVGITIYALRLLNSPRNEKAKLTPTQTAIDHGRTIVNALILTLLIIFVVGVLGGFAIQVSEPLQTLGDSLRPEFLKDLNISREEFYPLNPVEWLQNGLADGIQALGALLNTLGTLIKLLMPLIVASIAGFSLSNIASNLLSVPLRNTPPALEHIMGGILGALVGGVLLAITGYLGMSAALLGLLTPIIVAILTGEILIAGLRRIYPPKSIIKDTTFMRKVTTTAIFWMGAILAFIFTFNTLSIGRALIDGTLPPVTQTSFLGLEIFQYILTSATIGAVLGGIGGALVGVHSDFPLGSTLYTLSRAALNTIRSIEPLIMGLVFVIWVGIGAFAGVLALTLHSVAALGKLYSEQVENIDPGPVEAIQSTGASWLQTVVYGVIPQIVPPYIAFTMYRWDINVRMSTIIGFVGGGGIGLLLQQQINLLRYRDAGVAVLAIAVVVSILDYISAYIREKLT